MDIWGAVGTLFAGSVLGTVFRIMLGEFVKTLDEPYKSIIAYGIAFAIVIGVWRKWFSK